MVFKVAIALSNLWEGVTIFSKLSDTNPVAVSMLSRVSLNSSAPAFVICKALFPASMEENISTRERLFCSAYLDIISRISPNDFPESNKSLKLVSVKPALKEAFCRFSLAVVPLFPSSDRMEERPVEATSVLVPCLVISARADVTFSMETPKAEATGVTFERALLNSPTVVTPKFCVLRRISETLLIFSIPIP